MREYLGTAFLPPPSPSQGPDKEGVTDLPSWGISSRRRSPGWIGGDSGEVAGGGGKLSIWEGLSCGPGSSEQLQTLRS